MWGLAIRLGIFLGAAAIAACSSDPGEPVDSDGVPGIDPIVPPDPEDTTPPVSPTNTFHGCFDPKKSFQIKVEATAATYTSDQGALSTPVEGCSSWVVDRLAMCIQGAPCASPNGPLTDEEKQFLAVSNSGRQRAVARLQYGSSIQYFVDMVQGTHRMNSEPLKKLTKKDGDTTINWGNNVYSSDKTLETGGVAYLDYNTDCGSAYDVKVSIHGVKQLNIDEEELSPHVPVFVYSPFDGNICVPNANAQNETVVVTNAELNATFNNINTPVLACGPGMCKDVKGATNPGSISLTLSVEDK
jgi:hypothetical protein